MRQTTTKHTPLHIIIKRRLSASESFLIPALPTTRVTPQGRNGTHPCMRIAGAAYPDTRGVTRLSVTLHRPIEPRVTSRPRWSVLFSSFPPAPAPGMVCNIFLALVEYRPRERNGRGKKATGGGGRLDRRHL
jgi:hypothetical protein